MKLLDACEYLELEDVYEFLQLVYNNKTEIKLPCPRSGVSIKLENLPGTFYNAHSSYEYILKDGALKETISERKNTIEVRKREYEYDALDPDDVEYVSNEPIYELFEDDEIPIKELFFNQDDLEILKSQILAKKKEPGVYGKTEKEKEKLKEIIKYYFRENIKDITKASNQTLNVSALVDIVVKDNDKKVGKNERRGKSSITSLINEMQKSGELNPKLVN